ncbi:ATP-binding protein [Desulfuromonas thiophila]|uniref:ATP-binding protein n=1 Tax=Desulfuromonas thiophila TaxID=57664 RepID=UPI0024A97A27|nr:ATP-binding protein [Desulfuromonas thiophila]
MHNKTAQALSAIQRLAGKAIGDFALLRPDDRVLVALSGGKDSWALLEVLVQLQKKAPICYQLQPAIVDPGFGGFDHAALRQSVEQRYNLPLHIIATEHANVIREHLRPGSACCAFCARLRRGALYGAADTLGCNVLALGHHRDDALETLLLNQFYSGSLSAMSASLLADNGRHRVIRPLIYVPEALIQRWISSSGLVTQSCNCPQEALIDQKRQAMKTLLDQLEQDIPQVRNSLLNALANVQPRHLLDRKLWPAPSQTGNIETATGAQ